MTRILMMAALLAAPLFASSAPAEAQSCRSIGSTYFCGEGRSGQRSPINPSLNTQPRNSPLGNQRYTDPQKRANDPGNALFPTNNRSTRKLGDTTYNRDGTRCRAKGTVMSCE